MKTKILNLVAPLAVVAFGLAGAASTNSVDKTESTAVMGWKQINGSTTVCDDIQLCSNSGTFDCTAPDGAQLYAKPGSTCAVPLKRNTQH